MDNNNDQIESQQKKNLKHCNRECLHIIKIPVNWNGGGCRVSAASISCILSATDIINDDWLVDRLVDWGSRRCWRRRAYKLYPLVGYLTLNISSTGHIDPDAAFRSLPVSKRPPRYTPPVDV